MGLAQFLPILSSLAAPVVMKRWGTGYTLILTSIVTSLFMLLIAFLANWYAASMGYIGVLLTLSIAAIARNLYSQEIVAPHWRTIMSAAYTLGLALGWASAAGVGGYLIAAFGYRALFLLGALAPTCAALLLWRYLRTGSGAEATPSARLGSAP
jgi:predicted MFS family arabinose efflux permease